MLSPALTIAGVVAVKLIEQGTALGLPRESLLTAAGLSPHAPVDPVERLPIARLYDLWAHIMRAVREPGLPMRLADGFGVEDMHIVGFAILTCTDGRDALRRLVRFGRTFTDSGEYQLDEEGGVAHVRWVREGPRTLGHRVANEHALAWFTAGCRGLLGAWFAPQEVRFRHPSPGDVAAHLGHFRCPVRFGAAEDALTLRADLLDLPLPMANQAINAYFVAQAEGLLRDVAAGQTVAARVRLALAQELRGGNAELTVLARRLGMSERSLRRHLAQEGTSFRSLLTDARRERAEDLLRSGWAAPADIAELLGFADVNAFNRAFKRWSGMSPQAFRRKG